MRYLIAAFAALVLATSPLAAQVQTGTPAPQDSVTPQVSTQPTATRPAPKPNRLAKRFAAANTTHDGHLTLDQAKSANWKQVIRHFAKIDTNSKGYVTEQEIRIAAAQARSAKPAAASKT